MRLEFWSLKSYGGALCTGHYVRRLGSYGHACGRGIAEIVGCRDDARMMDVMECDFVSAARDGFGLKLGTGRIAVGIRWSRGFRSDGVAVEGSSLLKGIVRFLGLVVGWRAMSMVGSWHCGICR